MEVRHFVQKSSEVAGQQFILLMSDNLRQFWAKPNFHYLYFLFVFGAFTFFTPSKVIFTGTMLPCLSK